MRAALTISLKDLRERSRDGSALIFGIIAPLGLAFVFSTIFGGAFGVELDLDYVVVDRDGGPIAQAFTAGVVPAIEDEGLATFELADDLDAARQQVADGDRTALFLLPEGLSAAVTSGGGATIEIVGNVDASIGTQVADAIASGFATELSAVQIAVGAAGEGGQVPDAATAQEIAAAVSSTAPPIVVGEIDAATRELDPITYLSAGMAVFFLFFTVQFGVTSLLEERRHGTMQRLLAAPIRRSAVVGGKLLTSFLLGVIATTVLVVGSDLLIGAEWGDPVGVALLVVAGVVAATAIMAFLATIARTAEQAQVWQSIVAVVLGALGGTFFPIAQDGFLGSLALLTPHQWFLRGLAQLAGGGEVANVLPAVGAMLAFAAVGFGLAAVRMRGEALQ